MLVQRMAVSVVQRQVKYVNPVMPTAARGLVADVYTQVASEMKLVVPPVLLHSPVPDLLAAYWMLWREPLLPTCQVDRATKEAVATAVSVANICPYCVDMHSVGMYELATEHDAEALVADRAGQVTDPRLREIAAWARVAHLPGSRPPFPDSDRPELVGTVVSMNYLTRLVNVFLSPFLVPPRLGPVARRRFKRGASIALRPTLRDPREAGRSVGLLPEAPLPASAGWAAGAPHIEAAVARAYAAFDAAGQRSLPPVVREVVSGRLDEWRGEEMGLSRAWCERLISGLTEAERAAARVALITALASYQIDEGVIIEFRRWHEGDDTLLDAVAWAAFAASERVGALYLPYEVPKKAV